MAIYQVLSAASPTQAKAKPQLWPGFGSRLGLTILKAKAASGQAKAPAFRPSWARTSLTRVGRVEEGGVRVNGQRSPYTSCQEAGFLLNIGISPVM
jgi:hypothetical protein